MPAVSHHGHLTDVHVSYAPGSIIATDSKFTIAGQAIARVGDELTDHPHLGSSPPHKKATITAGSGSFSVAGKAVVRVGDPTSCGGKIAQGVGDFFVGG